MERLDAPVDDGLRKLRDDEYAYSPMCLFKRLAILKLVRRPAELVSALVLVAV
jgi:hypothetical protein